MKRRSGHRKVRLAPDGGEIEIRDRAGRVLEPISLANEGKTLVIVVDPSEPARPPRETPDTP